MSMNPYLSTEVSENQLQEMLAAYAGPEEARPSPRHRRRFGMLVLAALVLGLAATTAVILTSRVDEDRSAESDLTSVTAGSMRGLAIVIPVEELIARSDVIFVGVVTAINGPEELSPANPPDYPTSVLAYRVTFEVERLLRGEQEETIELTNTQGRGPAFSAQVGERYLIFAASEQVGYERVPRLVAVGIGQGVFHVTDPRTAVNSRGVTIDPGSVESQLEAARSGR